MAFLAELPSLRSLEMADCGLLTDEGVEALVAAPGLSGRLERLVLRRCLGVTDDGIAALKFMTALRYLDLTGCAEVTGEAIEDTRGSLNLDMK